MKKTIAIALVTLAVAVPAAASGGYERGAPHRRETAVVVGSADVIQDVETDIRRGVQRGRLNRDEARSLRADVRDYEALRRRVLRDERISHGEEKQLARAADHLEGRLRRQLRDTERTARFDGRHDHGDQRGHDERGHDERRDGRDDRHDNDRRDGRDDGGRDGRDDDRRDGYRPVVAMADGHHGC